MNKSILSALIVVLILAVWMISGVASDNPDKTIKPDTHSAEQTMKVSMLNSKLKTVQRYQQKYLLFL